MDRRDRREEAPYLSHSIKACPGRTASDGGECFQTYLAIGSRTHRIMQAEESLRAIVAEKYHSLNEEMITHLFWCELAHVMKKTSDQVWSSALCQDLSAASYQVGIIPQFDQECQGLFCEVQLHNHSKEGKTGGRIRIKSNPLSLPHRVLESQYASDGVVADRLNSQECCTVLGWRSL